MPRFSPVFAIRPVPGRSAIGLCRNALVAVGPYSRALQQFSGASLYWRLPEV